ncbi:MAG: MarR family winged helix-turn-helix transcriptional regulator [Actinocrinis sp.]
MPPDPTASGGPPPSVAFLLSKLGYEVSRDLRARLRPLGIEPRQFGLLRLLARTDGVSQRALGQMLEITANRMVALIDDLERKGLIERRSHPADRRAYAVSLTDTGAAVLDRAFEVAVGIESEVCSRVNDVERTQLLALLSKVAAPRGDAPSVHPGLLDQDS